MLPILNRNLLLHGVSFEATTATHFVVLAGSRMPGEARSGFQPNVIYGWKIMKWNGDALGLQIDSCAEPLAPYTVLMHAAIDAVKRSDIPSGSRVHFLTSNPDVNRLLNQDRSIRRKNMYTHSSRSKKPLSHANKWRELDDALDELNLRASASGWWSKQSRREFEELRRMTVHAMRSSRDHPFRAINIAGHSKEVRLVTAG